MIRVTVFDRLDTLNSYLADKKYGSLEIKVSSMLVGEKKGDSGEKVWEILDRFTVIEK